MYLFFDTETSGLPNFKAPNSDPSQPWVVQLAAVLTNELNHPLQTMSLMIRSEGLPMSPEAEATHGISVSTADTYGIMPAEALGMFINLARKSTRIIAHNISFDMRLLKIMATRVRSEAKDDIYYMDENIPKVCTMMSTAKLCNLPYPSGKKGCKWPKLEELASFLFGAEWLAQWLCTRSLHDALVDVELTRECYFELVRRG